MVCWGPTDQVEVEIQTDRHFRSRRGSGCPLQISDSYLLNKRSHQKRIRRGQAWGRQDESTAERAWGRKGGRAVEARDWQMIGVVYSSSPALWFEHSGGGIPRKDISTSSGLWGSRAREWETYWPRRPIFPIRAKFHSCRFLFCSGLVGMPRFLGGGSQELAPVTNDYHTTWRNRSMAVDWIGFLINELKRDTA